MPVDLCRICEASNEFYEKAQPGSWNYDVCKSCCREDYAVRVERVRDDLAKNSLGEVFCPGCEKDLPATAYYPSALTSAERGFLYQCKACRKSARNN